MNLHCCVFALWYLNRDRMAILPQKKGYPTEFKLCFVNVLIGDPRLRCRLLDKAISKGFRSAVLIFVA